MLSNLLSDIRNAARGLARTPVVALSAILCLALGIGATAAISSAVSRALLQSLPFRDAGELVAVHRVTPQSGAQGSWPMSPANYADLAGQSHRVRQLAAIGPGLALVSLRSEAVRASQLYVTGNLFPMLGVRAERGRLITPSDDRPDQPPVAVLSSEFWRSKLGADPGVVGSTVLIDGEPTTIVGVAPPRLRVPHGGQVLEADVWMPIRFTPQQLGARRSNYLFVLGRLAPDATPGAAQAELRGIFDRIVDANPELRGEGLRVARLQPDSVASIRTPLLLLFGAVCLVLLIACTNVAALLLARGVQRGREVAVRSALGASRWRVMRHVLAESLLVAVIGAACGLALAAVGVRTIGALAGSQMPQLAGLTVDGRVVAFACLLTVVTAALCGAAPAWRAATLDPQDALRGGRGGGAGRGHHRALGGLVVAEIAVSLVLLIGAGLVMRAFAQLLRSDAGFDTAHVLTLRATIAPTQYGDRSPVRAFLEPALNEIRAIPGVEAAGAISATPYAVWGNNSNIRYEGHPADDPTRLPIVEGRRVSPGFFDVTKQRLIAGRLLRPSDDDSPSSPPVVVVNQALVERDLKGEDPVGKRFYLDDTTFATIVGVVSDIRNVGPVAPPAPEMYWTYLQGSPSSAGFPIMVRVRGDDPTAVAAQVRAAIRRVDPGAAISDLKPMSEVVAASLGRPRFYFTLLGAFAVVAIVLAGAGLYGVMSYSVAQRTRELGIRYALGSPAAALIRLVLRRGAGLVALGVILGLVGAAMVTRLMTFMLYGVSPLDAAMWALASVVLIVVALVAVLVPARRATRVSPTLAMQAE